jgi:sugar lactone lactonase YvrE
MEIGVPEGLSQPEAVAWTPDGVLAIADTWNHRVLVFDPVGVAVRSLPAPPEGWYGPRGIAVAENGTLAVTDTGHKRVVLMDSSGGDVATRVIGAEGADPGQLVEPVGLVWIDRTRMLVCDTGNRRLQVLDRRGRAEAVVELPEAWADFYSRPQIAVVDEGLWLASDTPAESLWLIRDGETSRLPTGDVELVPTGVAARGSTLVVTDLGGRIWVFGLELNS